LVAAADAWTLLAPMPSARSEIGAAAIGSTLAKNA
jgi:hypothetical protein